MFKSSVNMLKEEIEKSDKRIRQRKANITHDCFNCGRLIYPKNNYFEITGIDDYYFYYTLRLCLSCSKFERGCNMKREKIELKPALKAQDFKEGQVIKATAFIKEVFDVETKFGDKTIITFDDGDNVFMNAESNNKLIERFGNDDNLWLNKAVKLTCERDRTFNKLMLVVSPIA